MKTVHFTARLLGDAVISERSATSGGHRCLDHIPGACLLGAAASRIYNELGSDAFTIFHSGQVRFGNAYPLDSDARPTLPIPLSWHCEKGVDLGERVDDIKNLLHATVENFAEWDKQGVQQKQIRNGYFSSAGELVRSSRCYRMKTAIDRKRQGMAEDGQLFGYEALAAGSLWYFNIAFDDQVPERLIEKVADALSGRIRVGRSRSAEYGLLQTEKIPRQESVPVLQACNQLFLYCVSDLALIDHATGCPVLVPTARHFGLPEAEFNAGMSYLRTRCYVPFNGTRRRFDLERQVIVKGSVLVFTRNEGFSTTDLAHLNERLAAGVGLYRQDGLGLLLANPPFLAGFGFSMAECSPSLDLPVRREQQEIPPLATWLAARADEQKREVDAIVRAEHWMDALLTGSCPSNSQWGKLRNIAACAVSVDKIRAEVGELCEKGVSQKQWQRKFLFDGMRITYGKFIQERVLHEGITLEGARRSLYLLANRLPRRINQMEGGAR